MPLQKLSPFLGINKDLGVESLPLGAVTDANNVRFREGYAELFLGQTDAYTTAPLAPYTAFPVRTGSTIYWLVLGAAKAYAVTGAPATWTNITRQTASVDVDYAATLDTLWNGGVLNGVPIVNNGVDVPQYWSTISTGTKLAALPNWPGTATCRVMRPFMNYMFAFDVTKAGTRYPHRVKWSHPADPGTVPTSWDETDATKDAGEFDLEGASFVVDALPLGNALIIYKQNSAHICTFAGAGSIFNFRMLFSNYGMLGPDCGVEIDGSHYVLTQSDVIRHDGTTVQSILDKATRRWLFQNIDTAQYDRCFVTKNVYFNEVWICFPELGQTSCTKALIYNYKDGTVSFRDLPNVTSANVGQVDSTSADTWDADSNSWDSDLTGWNSNEFGAQSQRTMLCAPSRPALVLADQGTQNFGSYISGFVERTGISLDAPTQVKTIKRLRPIVKAPTGTQLTFRVGGAMDAYSGVTWSSPVVFTVGTDVSVDAFATGRELAWRVESSSAYTWRIERLDIDVVPRGDW